MNLFWKRMKNCLTTKFMTNNRGLSLVELICAIAILGVVTASVGSIMVISAKHYQRGVTEVGLQQEAQFAANQIADLVIDTTAEVTYTDAGAAKELSIQKEDRCYKVTYRSADARIVLSEYQINADNTLTLVGEAEQLMAENVTDFEAVIPADFMDSGSLQLRLKFEDGDKTFESWYTITARNGILEENIMEASATLITESEVTLEPNQTFLLEATVIGPANTNVIWSLENNNDTDTVVYQDATTGLWYLKIGRDETSASMQLQVKTVATRSDNLTPLAARYIPIHVRRVNAISVSGGCTSGTDYVSGSVYRVSATLDGTALERVLSVNYDVDYVDPYQIAWTYELTNPAGETVTNIGNYIDFNESRTGVTPFTDITLKQDLGLMTLKVTATALHPAGTNKTTQSYDSLSDTWALYDSTPVPLGGKSLLGVEIVPTALEAFHPTYASVVSTDGFTNDEKAADLVYTWSVDRTDLVESYTNGTSGQTFQVKFTQAAANQIVTITLRVKSLSLSALYGTEIYVEDTIVYNVPRAGDGGDSYLERGKDGNNNIPIRFTMPDGITNMLYSDNTDTRNWDVYLCDASGNAISSPGFNIKDYLSLAVSQGQIICNITTELPLNQDYYVMVKAYYQNWQGAAGVEGAEYWTYERIIYIPKVTIQCEDMTIEWLNHWDNTYLGPIYHLYGYYHDKWKVTDANNVPINCGVEVLDIQFTQDENTNATVGVTFPIGTAEYVESGNNNTFKWYFKTPITANDADDNLYSVKVQSITVKVYAKEAPDIYDICTIYFVDNENNY